MSTIQSQFCTFTVDGLDFGVAVSEVQEVLRYQPMTPVPQAPPSVRGLINLRGQIVTALDVRLRLGLPPRAADVLPMNVIVRSHGEVVSLLVDDIGDVIDTGDLAIEAAPANLPPQVREVVQGVVSLPNTILLALDVNSVVDVVTTPDPSAGTGTS